VLHYTEKRKIKLIIFITGLHNTPQVVASAARPFTPPQNNPPCRSVLLDKLTVAEVAKKLAIFHETEGLNCRFIETY
jgi:hypothetical protein